MLRHSLYDDFEEKVWMVHELIDDQKIRIVGMQNNG